MPIIYYQDRPIIISSDLDSWSGDSVGMIVSYDRATFQECVNIIGRGNAEALFLFTPDENETMAALKEITHVIQAAGGVVKNASGEVLVIRRNNKWDLPKGKLEKGEGISEGAAREIEEECAVNVNIIAPLVTTYHLYDEKGKRILKETFWFSAEAKGNPELKPQLEEGITEVKWFRKSEMDTVFNDTYRNIIEVLNHYFKSSSGV